MELLFSLVEIRGFLPCEEANKGLDCSDKMLLKYYPFMVIEHYFCANYLNIF